MAERDHLSIGEVLNLLQDEFPDITISKIRFLESQGLLDPERTPSGYRKFYPGDIDQLRWILRQQRENFLPLKVIKDRLASGDLDGTEDDDVAAEPTSVRAEPVPAAVVASSAAGDDGPGVRQPRPSKAKPPRAAPTRLHAGETSVSLTLEELVAATGLTPRVIGDLERYGLVTSRTLGTSTYYDDDALVASRLAAAFISHGVEPRHLRMYKVAAEREAGVFEQLIMPMIKQRSPGGRSQAITMLEELAGLGDQLRSSMLRQALREYLGHM